MKIYIMSHARHDLKLQNTLTNLHEDLLSNVSLVVQDSQSWDYEPIAEHFNIDMIVLPPNITSLSPSIEYIGKTTKEDKFFILDDDLRFAMRDGLGGLININNSEELLFMFDHLEIMLDSYAMVGISARFGNNFMEKDYKLGTRQMCFHGFRKEEFMMFDHNRVKCRQDFDRTLQYLKSGYLNYVDYNYTHDQNGSNTEGGCSVYRDHEMLKEQAYKLSELHPGIVSVRKKITKGSWGGGERYDVVVQWKKAIKLGELL